MSEMTAAPRLGNLPLLQSDGARCIGAGFQLAKNPSRALDWTSGDWEISISRTSRQLVVRGRATNSSYEEALALTIKNLQRGLDVISATFGVDLLVTDLDGEHIVWWPDDCGLAIRRVSIGTMRFDASATLTVRTQDGKVVPPTPRVSPTWHESFRYYRLSQTTEDLFDAYRNAYLAFESILNDIAPQKVQPNGNPAEKEAKWLRRALTEAHRLYNLHQWIPLSMPDPISYVFDTLYKATRSAMFHAKGGGSVLLPQTPTDRAIVLENLRQLVSLYQGVAEKRVGARWSGGSLSSQAARSALTAIHQGMTLYASDDETMFSESETSPNPGGGKLCRIDEESSVTFKQSDTATQLWATSSEDLAVLPFIRRVVGVRDGSAAVVDVLPERLYLQGSQRFETTLGTRIVSARSPRSTYSY